MSREEYMIVHSKYLPPEIWELYKIDGLISEDGCVYINNTKRMYGLKQASIIYYKQLIDVMDPHN